MGYDLLSWTTPIYKVVTSPVFGSLHESGGHRRGLVLNVKSFCFGGWNILGSYIGEQDQ